MGIEFQKEREKYVGYCQSVVGIGLMSGPVIGSVLYSNLGFGLTFGVFALLLLICGIMVGFLLPSRLNIKPVLSEESLR